MTQNEKSILLILTQTSSQRTTQSDAGFKLLKPVVDSLHARLLCGDKCGGRYGINAVTPVGQWDAIFRGDSADYLLQMKNIRFDLPMIHSPLQGRCYFYFLWNEFEATHGTDNRFRCRKLDALGSRNARHEQAVPALEGPSADYPNRQGAVYSANAVQ
ncbi:hypothetical protein ABH944_005220 [Caballeronia udeis]|uniref:Uncharacterized protein n=1 Tax=Caballeronia udeis TaxID=1232866 RepID=A0ABW8MMZ0_9BURK